MRCTRLLHLSLLLGLTLALAGGMARNPEAWAQEGGPQHGTAPQASVGTAFTYQGRLLDNGTPVEGTCGFGLSLYGSLTGPDQIGTTQDKPSIPVSNGYFTVSDLDFGTGAFDGNARYLEIAVDCGGGPVTLDPRVALNATPYAHSLRPGAKVEGTGIALQLTTSATSGSALDAIASASSGDAAAVYGSSSSSGGSGLSGRNTSSGYGVYGSSSGGYGVYGRSGIGSAKVPLATGVGVWGDGDSTVGVYGTSNGAGGVVGWSTSSAGVGGVSASGHGVHGASSSGAGVHGTAPNTGTVGIASSTAMGYGVYGRNASSSGAGVYGEAGHSNGTGVRGDSANGPGVDGSSDSGNGVMGSSTSGDGVRGVSSGGSGVQGTATVTGTAGHATSSSGATYGVYGKADSASGRGVYGAGGYYGVYGEGTDLFGRSYGVYGETSSRDGGSAGVFGYAKTDDHVAHGVQGRTNSSATGASGVYGYASAASGAPYGVYGKAESPEGAGVYGKSNHAEGYGVYSEGNAHVEGNLTWEPKTGYVSVPAAAFRPENKDVKYFNEGWWLYYKGSSLPENMKAFFAPVVLPHNANLKSLTFRFCGRTGIPSDAFESRLLRMDINASYDGGPAEIAFIPGEEMTGGACRSLTTSSVSHPTVDNSRYTYYLGVWMIGTLLEDLPLVDLRGAIIEYEISETY